MDNTFASSTDIRRSLTLKSGASGRMITPRGSSAPVPEDIFKDDDSVFSESWDTANDPHGIAPSGTLKFLNASALMKSYVPQPWFNCTPLGYYAASIRCKMGVNSIALIFDENDYLMGARPESPNKIVIVPPEAGMYLRPVTRESTPFRAESALPWVAFKSSPRIEGAITKVPSDPSGPRGMLDVEVSIKVADIVEAASYYRNLIDLNDLDTFVKSLDTLNTHEIRSVITLPFGFHNDLKDMKAVLEIPVHMRLCFFYHEVSLRNYEPF